MRIVGGLAWCTFGYGFFVKGLVLFVRFKLFSYSFTSLMKF